MAGSGDLVRPFGGGSSIELLLDEKKKEEAVSQIREESGKRRCNSLNFQSFSRDLRNEIDQCTYSKISPGNAHSWDANLKGKASTGLSSHD